MININTENCLFLLGILGCSDREHLGKFKIGKKTLTNMIKGSLIKKELLIVNGVSRYVYILDQKGISLFRKLYPNYDIGRSRSLPHDYFHSCKVIELVDDINILKTYKNEKYIRNKYRDKIKEYELKYDIQISCPDCSLIIDSKKIYIETLFTTNKTKEQNKKNFEYILNEGDDLIIFKI